MKLKRYPRRVVVGGVLLALMAGLVLGRRELLRMGLSAAAPPCILALGLDDDGRADAIFILYPGATPRVLVLPRDTFCTGGHKLNAMWRRLDEPHFMALCGEIVGHEIRHYVAVPFPKLRPFLARTFPQGLRVKNEYALHYRDRRGGFQYTVPAGDRVLMPAQLVWFLRDRYSDPHRRGEGARVARWRTFFRAAARELATRAELTRVPAIAADASRTFPTNLSSLELTGLALSQLTAGDVVVTYAPWRPIRIGKQLFAQLNKAGTRRLARLARAGIVPPPGLRVFVRNGTAAPGLAGRIARRLETGFGLDCETGNAPTSWQRRTTVEYTPVRLSGLAQAVAGEIAGAKVRPADPELQGPALFVTLGSDAIRTAERGDEE